MKIGIIVCVYLPSTIYGGVTSVAAEHAQELSSRGNEITILTSNLISLHPKGFIHQAEEMAGNIRILRFPSFAIIRHFSFIFSPPLLLWLKKHAEEFDIFHIHYGRELFSFSSAELLLRLGKKVFLQTHGMLDRREGVRKFIDQILIKSQLNRACGVFALQSHEYNVQKGISPRAKVLILPNGIRLAELPSWKPEKAHHTKTILFLSRLHPRKKVLDFIDAAKILLSRRIDLEFNIVGPDGGDRGLAEQKILSDDQLRSHVKLIGPVNRTDALQTLAESDIYVLPSVDEPFPMSLVEALAIGIPSVVTDRVHIVDFLRQYDVAEIVSPGPSTLVDGIEKLLNDDQLCSTRSRNGRNLVENKLTIQEIAKQLELFYSM